ncbi:hypothetical protein B0H11DRAFT_1915338 [Mycena galericulata]|nr:hypothetical protein B0H11DRAFT_1915338 [Mycena galericulata]
MLKAIGGGGRGDGFEDPGRLEDAVVSEERFDEASNETAPEPEGRKDDIELWYQGQSQAKILAWPDPLLGQSQAKKPRLLDPLSVCLCEAEFGAIMQYSSSN